jgi:hypothetical protein
VVSFNIYGVIAFGYNLIIPDCFHSMVVKCLQQLFNAYCSIALSYMVVLVH